MDIDGRMIGVAGCQLVVGIGPTAVKTGYQAYGAMVRVDNTQIMSVNKIETDTNASGVVTDESWQAKDLKASIDYIPFEDPITSITLASAAHSVMLFLEHQKST